MPTFTMRLPEEDYEALQAMSLLTGRAMAELVRDAVADSITTFAKSNELERRYAEELQVRQTAMQKLTERREAREREARDVSMAHDVAEGEQESEVASAKI